MKRLIILFPILISLILRIDSHAELPHQFLFGHTHRVLAIAFSSNGQWLASGGDREYEIYIWDVETGEHIHTLTGHTAQIKGPRLPDKWQSGIRF